MNTAPVTTTLTDTGVALLPVVIGGVTLPAGSTPQQRLAAHAQAGTQSQFHVDSTAMKFAQGDGIAGKASPPTPKQLERQNAMPTPEQQAAKVAAFDAEQRAAGKQITPRTSEAVPADQVDQAGIAALNKGYADKMAQYERMDPSSFRDKNIARTRAQYQEEMQEFYQGRKLSEKRSDFQARRDGTSPAQPAPAAPTAKGWQSHVQDGQVDLDKITTADTSGYTIPRFVQNQTLKVEAFEQLRKAKAAGFTQAQVNAYLRQDAVGMGWVKA